LIVATGPHCEAVNHRLHV